MIHIATALENLRLTRIIHRNIQADNISLNANDEAVLGDFSEAAAIQKNALSLAAHTKVGAALYISPEVQEDRQYTYSTDMWSVGVLLCELTTNKKPFLNETDVV